MSKEVILTGLRANNDLTLGNFFGAMKPIIDMAKQHAGEFQVNMFIPDLHSFTTPIDHSVLHSQIMHTAVLFAAAGLPIDNPDIHLYRQSYISAHSEMTVILNNFVGMGEMERMTQYKDKSSKLSSDRISVGLFDYPVLMASDILLYGALYVPVGDDQTQHLEITRDIAERINNQFGTIFIVPAPVTKQHEFFGKDQGLRIMDLQDPTRKMSKSDDSGSGVIFLGDEPAIAAKKIMRATTDDKAYVDYDKINQPGISNLLEILALLRQQTINEITSEFNGMNRYGDFKKIVADEVGRFLQEFQSRVKNIDTGKLESKMVQSEVDMSRQANETLTKLQKAVGLR